MPNILLDLNYPKFQEELFNLEKVEQTAFLKTCKKLRQTNWVMIYKDRGLKWEEITTKRTTSGDKVFSIRFSQKYRATVTRSENFMIFMTIHVDHDSAYN